ncbi:MAG: hypothetical protein ACM3NP_03325 [Actinomycetota bacterium]
MGKTLLPGTCGGEGIRPDTVDGKDLEFLELKNTGRGAVNISGITIDTAVYYRVPEGVMQPPKGFRVIASKPEEFHSCYGMSPSCNFSGNLSNVGEYVLFTDKNSNRILSFTFSDDSPWPAEADGDGYSLVSLAGDPAGDPNTSSYWRQSANKGGSPFANDPVSTSTEEIPERKRAGLSVYPNPSHGLVVVSIGSEDTGAFKLRVVSSAGVTVLSMET